MLKIKKHQLFICSTDTVLGLGGKINKHNYKKIYFIKKRDFSKPLIIIIANLNQLKKFEKISKEEKRILKDYWPGATTFIINNNSYRIPKNKKLLKFLRINGPIYLTSANISNHSTIKNIQDVNNIFHQIKLFDFGFGSGNPSTIINIKTKERLR